MHPDLPFSRTRTLTLFAYGWSAVGFERQAHRWNALLDHRGFDLQTFPSNVRLLGFDIERYADRLAGQARHSGWSAATSTHEQFGSLVASLLAERMGWPGTPVEALLACQHKLHARNVLGRVAPEANLRCIPLEVDFGDPIPEVLDYPLFVKPVKAAFSVLAKEVHGRVELEQHTRFGWAEQWVIRRLVEPFERVARSRLGTDQTAHGLMVEEPVRAPQYNLDGYVFRGDVRALGTVDAVMYPGTHAFMRFELPSRLAPAVQARALDVARRFLSAVGFDHGQFNMEFFYDERNDRLTVIEFNPRMASQFSDLYLRVRGIDLHAVALALAHGMDPAELPLAVPVGGAAASLVYRVFAPGQSCPQPTRAQQRAWQERFPGALLFTYPKSRRAQARDFKWLGSHRYGIIHLHGRDFADLRRQAEEASIWLGWRPPYEGALTGWSPAAPTLRPAS